MDMLAALRIFIRIAETGSFSSVAREMGATQPAISRQIASLEEHLGARLFQRSTRSLTLTEDGRDLMPHARSVVDAVEGTEAAIGRRRVSPSGMVRIGCPGVFGRLYVAPRLHLLLGRYPEMTVDLSMSDSVVDMVQEGLDLSIRVGDVQDASLVARRIGSTTAIAVASEAYLSRCGEPSHPLELSQHECIIFSRLPTPELWNFEGNGEKFAIPVSGRLRTNGIEAVIEAAMTGVGIALVPMWMLRDDMIGKKLRQILLPWRLPRRPISVVYPSRRFLAPRTRAVIDFLVDEFRLDPMVSSYGEL